MRRFKETNERGSAVVESALILLIALILMVGILDFGQIMFMHQTIMNRTQTVARQAAVKNYTVDNVKNLIVYNTQTPTDGTRGMFGLTASNVDVTFSDASSAEQRLYISVTNLDYRTYTPLFARAMKSMPIRLSVPTEQP